MDVREYLEKVAYIAPSEITHMGDVPDTYYSNFDKSYITLVGMEDNIKYLAEREITDELTHGVGYSPKEAKWYGWSHRAIYGFKIGSTCKKGDCHYRASNLEDEMEAAKLFWSDDCHLYTSVDLDDNGEIQVSWKYDDKVPNMSLRGTTGGCSWEIPSEFGKGEWTAKTMEDAKQMAIDFNEGVS